MDQHALMICSQQQNDQPKGLNSKQGSVCGSWFPVWETNSQPEFSHELGNLTIRLSSSSMWTCCGTLWSAKRAISSGCNCWWVGVQSNNRSVKSEPRSWATDHAAAKKYISESRPGGGDVRQVWQSVRKRGWDCRSTLPMGNIEIRTGISCNAESAEAASCGVIRS